MRAIAELPSVHYVEQIRAVRRETEDATWIELQFYGPDCKDYQSLKLSVFFVGGEASEIMMSRLVQAINQIAVWPFSAAAAVKETA